MKKLLLLLITTFTLSCCNKDDDKTSSCQSLLPAETQTGANTFGCCINSNLLIPRDGTGTWGGNDSGFKIWGDPTGNEEYVEIDIKDYKSERTASILIHIQNLHQLGKEEYVLNESNGYVGFDGLPQTYLHCKVFNEATNSYQYYRSFENSGTLSITRYDFENRIVSGIFNCRVKNSTNPDDIIEIKQGRFDINTNTLPNLSFP